MPCPHLSPDGSDCLLLEEVPENDEGRSEAPLDEPVNSEWCLSSEKGYRNCPIYRKFLSELIP